MLNIQLQSNIQKWTSRHSALIHGAWFLIEIRPYVSDDRLFWNPTDYIRPLLSGIERSSWHDPLPEWGRTKNIPWIQTKNTSIITIKLVYFDDTELFHAVSVCSHTPLVTHTQRKKGTKTVPLGYYCYKWYPFFNGALFFSLIIMVEEETVPLSERVLRALFRKKGWKQCRYYFGTPRGTVFTQKKVKKSQMCTQKKKVLKRYPNRYRGSILVPFEVREYCCFTPHRCG